MAELGLVASVIAVIQVTTAVTTQAYEYGKRFKNAKDDLEKMNRELAEVAHILDKLKCLAKRAESSGKSLEHWPTLVTIIGHDGPLKQCLQALNNLLAELSPASSRGIEITERFKWIWKKERVEYAARIISMQKMAFIESLEVDQIGQSVSTGLIINEMSHRTSEVQKNKIIEWLFPTDPSICHEEARRLHEGSTGEWFTSSPDYAQWKGTVEFLPVVACSEVIERTLVYSGPRKDSRLAYFYFSFKDLEKQKTANLPRTLLAELILQTGVHEMPNEALFDFYEMHKHGMPPVKAVMDLLHKILNHGETFLIIDALDECPDNELERSDLCSMLETFHSWGCQGLHLLVTSRKAVYLAETLEGLVTQNPINICGAFLGGDIQKFIQSQLQFSKKHRKWPKSIRLEIEEALMQKADGMFQWVFCQLESLAKCVTISEIRTTLESLPGTLEKTYERIFMNIPNEYRSKAISVLQLIIYSPRPLRLEEVAEGAVISPEGLLPLSPEHRLADKFWIFELLPGLITMDLLHMPVPVATLPTPCDGFAFGLQFTNTLQFRSALRFGSSVSTTSKSSELVSINNDYVPVTIAHSSVVEYLKSTQILNGPAYRYHMNDQIARCFLARACFQYFKHFSTKSKSKHSKNKRSPAMMPEYHHPDDTLNTVCQPLALRDYILHYWDEHLELLARPIPPDIVSLVCQNILDEKPMKFSKVRYSASLYVIDVRLYSPNLLAEALYLGIQLGARNFCEILIAGGVGVDTPCKESGTPLQAAALRNNLDIVRLLIEAGADVNKTGGKFGSPIQAAARAGNIETMKLLIEAGADVNLNAGEYGKAIHAAEAKGNREMASLLRGAGADRNNAPLVITIPEKNPGALKVWCWMLDWSEEEFEGASALQQKALLSTRRQVQPSILKTAFSYIPIYFAGLRLEEQEETSSRSDGSWETTTSSEQCTIIA